MNPFGDRCDQRAVRGWSVSRVRRIECPTKDLEVEPQVAALRLDRVKVVRERDIAVVGMWLDTRRIHVFGHDAMDHDVTSRQGPVFVTAEGKRGEVEGIVARRGILDRTAALARRLRLAVLGRGHLVVRLALWPLTRGIDSIECRHRPVVATLSGILISREPRALGG